MHLWVTEGERLTSKGSSLMHTHTHSISNKAWKPCQTLSWWYMMLVILPIVSSWLFASVYVPVYVCVCVHFASLYASLSTQIQLSPVPGEWKSALRERNSSLISLFMKSSSCLLLFCILGPFSPPNLLPINTSLCSPNVCPLFLVLSLSRSLASFSLHPSRGLSLPFFSQ